MASRGKSTIEEVDIFDDGDLALAASPLADATRPAELADDDEPPTQPQPSTAKIESVEAGEGAEIPDAEQDAQLDLKGPEPTNASLKLRVRPATRARFDSFKADLTVALGGTRLTDSNIGRAIVDWFLFEAHDQVLEVAKSELLSLQRPPADDLVANAEFDDALREILARGIVAWARQLEVGTPRV